MKKRNIKEILSYPEIINNYIYAGKYYAYIQFKTKNLSIMNSEKQVSYIEYLARMISDIGECEIICTDIEHNFEDNIEYLNNRLNIETNDKIKKLIRQDLEYISGTNNTLPSKRIFIISLSNLNLDLLKERVITVCKILSSYELEYKVLSEDDIKNLLCKYYLSNYKKENIFDNEETKIISFIKGRI